MTVGDPNLRAELAAVAASLRAYLEWQEDSGAHGIPRRPRTANAPANAPAPEPSGPAGPAAVPAASVPAPGVHDAPVPAAGAAPARAAPAAFAPVPVAAAPATAEVPAGATPAPAPEAAPAAAPRALPVIADEVRACTKCELAPTRTNTVFSRGNPEARLVFVGEAPGADEDEQGLPFVGRAGQLLDKMIAAMGLSPETDVYVCNIVKCRPPGNRRPTPEETAACIPYLHEQLARIKPKVIVALGNTAVSALVDTKLGITKVRGQWKLYKGKTLVMPTYHPSYLLRPSAQQAQAKREAWDDLRAVMKELGLALPAKKGS